MLPEGTHIISIEDRDPDHYYMIMPGQTMIFPFKIPLMGCQTVETVHVLEEAQDWSLACWFSAKPLDNMLFERIDHWNEHKMQRVMRKFEIWDELILPEKDPRVGLSAFPVYYFNIRNLQNRPNTFKAAFSS